METNIDARRKEAVLLLLTVIILALLVSLLSDIIFEQYFNNNRPLFTIIIIISLVLTSVFGYFAIITKTTRTLVNIVYPFCFNTQTESFIDIEKCVPSVHARIHFDRLPEGYKRELAKNDDPDVFWGSDLDNFINDCVQAIFLDLVFEGIGYRTPPDNLVPYMELPETIKRNDCLRREFARNPEYNIALPKWAKLETYGDYGRFLKVSTKYGELKISWEVGFSSTAYHSSSYLTAIGIDPDEDAHEFDIEANLTYSCRFAYIHRKELDEYINWAQGIQRRFSELDWSRTREQLPLVIMQLLINQTRSSGKSKR